MGQALGHGQPGSPASPLCAMMQSKHLDEEHESSEEEREPVAVPQTWRASQPPLPARAQVAPRPPMAATSQIPSRHVLCLPPRNVTLLQERVRSLRTHPRIPSSAVPGASSLGTPCLALTSGSSSFRQTSW